MNSSPNQYLVSSKYIARQNLDFTNVSRCSVFGAFLQYYKLASRELNKNICGSYFKNLPRSQSKDGCRAPVYTRIRGWCYFIYCSCNPIAYDVRYIPYNSFPFTYHSVSTSRHRPSWHMTACSRSFSSSRLPLPLCLSVFFAKSIYSPA